MLSTPFDNFGAAVDEEACLADDAAGAATEADFSTFGTEGWAVPGFQNVDMSAEKQLYWSMAHEVWLVK